MRPRSEVHFACSVYTAIGERLAGNNKDLNGNLLVTSRTIERYTSAVILALIVLVLLPVRISLASAKPSVNLLDYSSAGQGTDDTEVLQRALNAAAAEKLILRVPASGTPYMVKPLTIPSNTQLIFDPGVVIQAAPGYGDHDHMINIDDASNVTIVGHGGVLRMRKPEYTEGEWRHCISVEGSENIIIRGLRCADSGGDGIYIGSSKARPYSRNVVIEDVVADNNRRQGLSIISAQDLWVRHCSFINTNGIEPGDGIDIEPNWPTERLVNINIEDCETANNKGDGVCVSIGRMKETSTEVSIVVRHHSDSSPGKSGYQAFGGRSAKVKGSVTFENCVSKNAQRYGAATVGWESAGPLLVFKDLEILNSNQSGETNGNTAIRVIRDRGALVGQMGNVHFLHPRIKDTTGKLVHYFFICDASAIGEKNVKFLPGECSGARKHPYGLHGDGAQRNEVVSVDVP